MNPLVLTLTYEQKLNVSKADSHHLDALMSRYQQLKRIMWQNLYGRDQRPDDMNAFKRDFQLTHQISSTGYNSLKYEVDALAKAQRELNIHHLKELEHKEKSVSTWIADKKEVVKNEASTKSAAAKTRTAAATKVAKPKQAEKPKPQRVSRKGM